MSSIFPRTNAGGLIVRDPTTGAQITQPDVYNVDVPIELNINCDYTALPEDCRAKVEPQQVNAIVSELVNFFVAMSPGTEWDCNSLDNLAEAFRAFVQDIAGEISGTLTCSVATGDGSEPSASLIYCDGTTLKKWSITGEDGLFEAVKTLLCSAQNAAPNLTQDKFVYCNVDGDLRTTNLLSLQLYLGEWVQASPYKVNNLVRKYGKLWSPNADIPAGTDFVIGDTGPTWYEVAAPGDAYPYDPKNVYQKDTVVVIGNHYYAANDVIPANAAFTVGTAGATWREVFLNNRYVYDHNPAISYAFGALVVKDDMLYRARLALGPSAWNPANWLLISGERNIYRGPWLLTDAYNANDAVEHEGRLYAANAAVAANTAFVVGTAGATWREISPSVGIAYQPDTTYTQDTIVSYDGGLYIANGNIPANVPPEGANIGFSGATWRPFSTSPVLRDFDAGATYAVDQIVAYENDIAGQKAVYRFTTGKIPGPMGDSEIVGERNKYRSHWKIDVAYKIGDLIRNNLSGYAYGTLFEANSDIAAGTPFVVGDGPNQWGVFNVSALLVGIYDPGIDYQAGDLVLTTSGIYEALEDIPAGTTFQVGDSGTKWRSYNTGRPTQRFSDVTVMSTPDHRNAHLLLSSISAKTYSVIAGTMQDGDTVSCTSINGQLTVTTGAGVTIYNKDSMTLIEADGASFYLRCLGNDEFVLSGDFLP